MPVQTDWIESIDGLPSAGEEIPAQLAPDACDRHPVHQDAELWLTQMAAHLRRLGCQVNPKWIQRLMQLRTYGRFVQSHEQRWRPRTTKRVRTSCGARHSPAESGLVFPHHLCVHVPGIHAPGGDNGLVQPLRHCLTALQHVGRHLPSGDTYQALERANPEVFSTDQGASSQRMRSPLAYNKLVSV